MVSLLKFLLILIEWGVQLKRRDDEAQKQERLNQARNDPAKYLRQFGRVPSTKPDKPKAPADPLRSSEAGTDQHDSQ